jgi:dTDP-4-amino-4,6-dideoxygalactose transaminase
MSRIYLSPPHLTGEELAALSGAVDSNWIAPVGPEVDGFERDLCARVGVEHAVALSSGTAALHLAMKLVGVEEGDEVIVPSLTFAATANAVLYERGRPVFVDCEPTTWNIDPELLEEELGRAARRGRLPRAVIVVDVFGQSADYDIILALCEAHDVPVIEDAAEALGATYRGRPVGGFGRYGVFSFNGNKIITTSGGGMLVSDDAAAIARARFLATQARESAPHYEHREVGYNYRMSNLLAAVGRVQLRALDERVDKRRRNFEAYRRRLGELPGVGFQIEAEHGISTRWLTCMTLDPEIFGASPEDVRMALEAEDIEARPVWKPMHLQPAYRDFRVCGGSVSAEIFDRGLCLPSGSSLSDADLDRICGVVESCARVARAQRL